MSHRTQTQAKALMKVVKEKGTVLTTRDGSCSKSGEEIVTFIRAVRYFSFGNFPLGTRMILFFFFF